MARPLRIQWPGAWYHVTARGNERRPIYRDDRDRQRFCQLLAEAVEHFRMVLNVSYSVWFNRRHGRVGHLFQGRYKAIVVDRLGWGLELSRYVHLNPDFLLFPRRCDPFLLFPNPSRVS